MMKPTARWSMTALASTLALAVAANSAHAIPLVFNGGTGANNFHTTISGTGSLTISANLSYRLSTDDFPIPGLVGTTLGGNINIPTQSANIAVQGGAVTINTTPTGSASLTLAGQQAALSFDPGGDGLPPFGPNPGTVNGLPSPLTYADMTNLAVTLVGNQNFALNPITVSGNTSLNILSLFDLNLDTEVRARPFGNLSNIAFTQATPGNDLLYSPGVRIPTPAGNAKDWTTRYGLAGAPGTFSGNISAGLDVDATLSLSVLGLFDIPFDFNLGSFNLISESLNEALGLIGNAELRDLNPAGYDGLPTGDDMRFTYNDGGLLGLLPLSFDLTTAGSIPVSVDTDISAVFGFDVDVRGTVNFSINANLAATNTGFQLQDTVENVVIPEPSGLLLAGLGALAALVPAYRRRRA